MSEPIRARQVRIKTFLNDDKNAEYSLAVVTVTSFVVTSLGVEIALAKLLMVLKSTF